jgi:RpiR family transcriptional regulator, carbohydrate utilization regulator
MSFVPRRAGLIAGESEARMRKRSGRESGVLVEGVLGRIRTQENRFFAAERRVADVVLAAPEEVVLMPISELAARANVAEGTVVRFCQAVGCRGYQALKISVAMELTQSNRVILDDVVPGDARRPAVVVGKVFHAGAQALEDTLGVLQEETFEAVVVSLMAARRIAVFAVGSSLPIALDATIRLMRIGAPVDIQFDSHMQLMRASILGPRDVGIGISHSGASRETVENLAVARSQGATTIAITGRRPSPLTAHADHVLLTVSAETRFREEAVSSRIAELSLIDAILVLWELRRSSSTLEALRTTSEALAARRVGT